MERHRSCGTFFAEADDEQVFRRDVLAGEPGAPLETEMVIVSQLTDEHAPARVELFDPIEPPQDKSGADIGILVLWKRGDGPEPVPALAPAGDHDWRKRDVPYGGSIIVVSFVSDQRLHQTIQAPSDSFDGRSINS